MNPPRLTHEQQRQAFIAMLKKLQEDKFFGTVLLNLQSGNIVLVEEHKKHKLTEVCDERSS